MGGVELTLAQLLIAWALAAAAAIAVYLHANRHGVRHATAWSAGVFLALVIALPLYVIHYRRQKSARRY